MNPLPWTDRGMSYSVWRAWLRMLWNEPMSAADWYWINQTMLPPEVAVRRIEEYMGPSPL